MTVTMGPAGRLAGVNYNRCRVARVAKPAGAHPHEADPGAAMGRQMRIAAPTGWGRTGDRRRGSEAGCDAHLVKPIDPVPWERRLER